MTDIITTFLTTVTTALNKLVDRIAPDGATVQQFKFYALPAGAIIGGQPYALTGPFNSFLVSIQSGTIDCYFGSYNQGNIPLVPDLQFGPTVNPIPISFQKRTDGFITFVVDAGTASPASGTIELSYY